MPFRCRLAVQVRSVEAEQVYTVYTVQREKCEPPGTGLAVFGKVEVFRAFHGLLVALIVPCRTAQKLPIWPDVGISLLDFGRKKGRSNVLSERPRLFGD